MKKKVVLTAAFAISLLPMLLNQYGGMRGVQEISGLINLLSPFGLLSVPLFLAGVWIPFQSRRINRAVGAAGAVGIVVSELYRFLTWHVPTVTGELSLAHSLRLAFPAFWFGLVVSVAMVVFYLIVSSEPI